MTKKKAQRYFSLLILLFLRSDFMLAQVEEWVAHYDGRGSPIRANVATALTVDAEGNVYVTGWSFGVGTDSDYATIKYDPEGNQVWVARYDGPGHGEDNARAIALDAEGNVYVTGTSWGGFSTREDYATIKYEQLDAGRQVRQAWVARYNGPGNRLDAATSLAVDSKGNVYVTGTSMSSTQDYATVKYDREGNPMWVARYNYGLADGGHTASALAVDEDGNVYVTGTSWGGYTTRNDYATIKYDPKGNQVWVARYDGPAHASDIALAIVLDAEGNVYVTGGSAGVGRGHDYATIKYDPEGNEVWVARYEGPAHQHHQAVAIALDREGNVYVTGGGYGIGTGYDYVTVKYDPEGKEVWVARYDGPGNSDDAAWGLALDAENNVYVTGWSRNVDLRPDYATIKYDPDGSEVWVARYRSPVNGGAEASAIALDSARNVYVTGESAGVGVSQQYTTIKYSQK